MECDPDTGRVVARLFHAVPAVSRDEDPVPGMHLQVGAIVEFQACVPLEHRDPFIGLLIEPVPRRGCMTVGDDPFDSTIAASGKDLAEFLRARQLSGDREEALHRFSISRIMVKRVWFQ